MLDRTITILAGASVLSMPSGLSAQSANPTPRDDFIMNAWSDPSDCNLDNAKKVSFLDLTADASNLLGDCVSVEGYWRGRALFGSIRQAKRSRSTTTDRLRGERIGLYAQWDRVGEPPDIPTKTIFAGRVGQCETQWPEAMMVMGYCHYTGGPILLVSESKPS